MDPKVTSYFDGIDNSGAYWTYEQMTDQGTGTLFFQGACTVVGGAAALVGIAVAGVAAAIFGTMALGPVGLAFAGLATLGVAVIVSMSILGVVGTTANVFFQSAFAGNAGKRYAMESQFTKDVGLTKLYKNEFFTKMHEPLTQHYKELLETLNTAEVAQREGLVEEYREKLDAVLNEKFPDLEASEVVKKTELKHRINLEKSLFFLEIYNKLGDPKPRQPVQEPAEEV